jgi:tRNA G18 (ribose-2'-O)-methylase SpoU
LSRLRQVSGLEESGFEVRSRDLDIPYDEYARRPKFPVTLVLDNLRSAFNVGALFRVADTARLVRLVTCGYTAHPPHPRLDKTALGTMEYVATDHYETTSQALASLRADGVALWALETTSQSRPYTEVSYPRPVALVLGNEALGIEPSVLDDCDELVEVPVFGYKNSLNVASAAAVVVFEILRQWGYRP